MKIVKQAKTTVGIAVLVSATLLGSLTLSVNSHAQTSPAVTASTTASAPAPIPLPPPMPVQKSLETVDNPYGLDALWAQGDFVAKGTLIILFIMSMGSWYILISKLIEQRKLFAHAKEASATFWAASSVKEGVNQLTDGSAFRYVAENVVEARYEHVGELAERVPLNTWVEMTFNRSFTHIQAQLQVGLAFLATVGSTAPFVGLFGTVWGIYHALTAIGIAGQASIDKVAGPVGEALIMTAIGLAVAVPAVLGYNWLVRRNKSAMSEVHGFSADLEKVLLGGNKPHPLSA